MNPFPFTHQNLRTIATDISQSLDRVREAMGEDLSVADEFRRIDLKLIALRDLADRLEQWTSG